MARNPTDGRWGDGRRADSDFAREQILDAALCCYRKNSLEQTRMEHIAREAKVSRTTIYRHFGNREEVVLGVLFRELNKLVDVMREQIAGEVSFAEFLVETLAFADEIIRSSPIFALMVRETGVFSSRIHEHNSAVITVTSAYLRTRFDMAKAAGQLREGIEFDALSDWISHVGASFILVPTKRQDSKEFRQILWRYLIPAIVRDDAIPVDKR